MNDFNHDAPLAGQPSVRCVLLCLPTNLDAIRNFSSEAAKLVSRLASAKFRYSAKVHYGHL
jgi:hypothetical protein